MKWQTPPIPFQPRIPSRHSTLKLRWIVVLQRHVTAGLAVKSRSALLVQFTVSKNLELHLNYENMKINVFFLD